MQVQWERVREISRRTQLVCAAEWRVRSCFCFLSNLALLVHRGAREVMGGTSPGCYFRKAMNTAFHNLTGRRLLPPATRSLLGLSLKFIPTPPYAPSTTDIAPSLDCIKHDIGLKTFFSGRDQEGEIPKLQAKSTWRPPFPPRQIDYWVNNFLKGLRGLFCRRAGKQNLTPPSTTTPNIPPGE